MVPFMCRVNAILLQTIKDCKDTRKWVCVMVLGLAFEHPLSNSFAGDFTLEQSQKHVYHRWVEMFAGLVA
ncbi:hypothetical protein ANRL1_01298 [Anaerolineae bacterium]|nr:hypothetical protein ANRL1_01298 [Anaerolineae bacterium]